MPAWVIKDAKDVTLPEWVHDLASFRRWTESEDFPEEGRIDYLAGQGWIDMSKEQIFSHLRLKAVFPRVVGGFVEANDLGLYLPDGARLSHPEADLSAVPDAVYLSKETIQQMRARLLQGAEAGYVEIEGSPDMVLEVVSDGSVRKDTEILRRLYWKAAVREYWLVDARHDPLSFEILRHTAKGYVATRKQKGWIKSAVFGKSFRLSQHTDGLGYPAYTLEIG
jgi:hypothetical protein